MDSAIVFPPLSRLIYNSCVHRRHLLPRNIFHAIDSRDGAFFLFLSVPLATTKAKAGFEAKAAYGAADGAAAPVFSVPAVLLQFLFHHYYHPPLSPFCIPFHAIYLCYGAFFYFFIAYGGAVLVFSVPTFLLQFLFPSPPPTTPHHIPCNRLTRRRFLFPFLHYFINFRHRHRHLLPVRLCLRPKLRMGPPRRYSVCPLFLLQFFVSIAATYSPASYFFQSTHVMAFFSPFCVILPT